MSGRLVGGIGLLLMAAYTLFLAVKIGSAVLIAIVIVVIAMAGVDLWQEAFKRQG
jgi:hypothetical protein